MCEYSACMYVYVLCVCLMVPEVMIASNLLELELKMIVNPHMDPGSWIWVSWKSSQCP